MRKRDKAPNATAALMQWVGSPDDPELEHATREILDSHFDENIFKVAAIAMARQELTAYPAIVELEHDLYQELFSKERRVTASNSELVQMGKLLH